ncbi:hypothetical protein AMTRI_Chr13g90740 [Amborella trichopoda]
MPLPTLPFHYHNLFLSHLTFSVLFLSLHSQVSSPFFFLSKHQNVDSLSSFGIVKNTLNLRFTA